MKTVALGLAFLSAQYGTLEPMKVQFNQALMGKAVVIMIDGHVKQSFAGKMSMRNANSSWHSVCADVRTPIANGQYFDTHPIDSAKLGGKIEMAGNIVAAYFYEATSPAQAAGLQLAVWEALEDGGKTPDFNDGAFQAPGADPIVLTYAQTYYGAVQKRGHAAFLRGEPDLAQSQLAPYSP